MLVSAESQVPKLISREIIFFWNSNAYDHNLPTLQTDRRTDGRTDRQLIMAIPQRKKRKSNSMYCRPKIVGLDTTLNQISCPLRNH